MAKLPTLFSTRHFLVLSLALNVSFILRMVYEGDQVFFNRSCSSNNRERERERERERGTRVATAHASFSSEPHKSALHISSSSSLPNFTTKDPSPTNRVINLDHGDPTVYEGFWRKTGEKTTITIPGWQSMSYFSDVTNICWFLESELAKELVRLHTVVGNAITMDRHIVVGTGSSQLFLAALYALSPPDSPHPISVVSASPYYSSYPSMTDYQKSGLYKWAGDAESFDKDGPYIELVTSPNNPDGFVRRSVVNRTHGLLVHDLAYYWPQYTPISSPADHDVTLFTVSKSTGHAGMRIGWAIVKDKEVAKKMTKFIELNTIGVSKDSQLRAAKVLRAVSDSCEQGNYKDSDSFFKFSYNLMANRWNQLRVAVERSGLFSVPKFSPSFCTFFNQVLEPHPAFVWLKCEGNVEDCESFLRGHKILTRSGTHFGVSQKYVRISMLDTDDNFMQFVDRLSTIKSQ